MVMVVDKNNKFLSYTHPAKARKLLNEERAVIFKTNPFIIKLMGPKDGRKKMNVQSMISFTDFFKDEKDIYIQNLSNTQVQFQCEIAAGRVKNVIIPRTRKPYNLTQRVSFNAIRESVDFRSLFDRNPPVIRIISEEDYMNYYKDLASRNNTSIDAEIAEANNLQLGIMDRKINEDAPVPKTIDDTRSLSETDDGTLPIESQVHPRIASLCAQVSPDVDDDLKMKANDFKDELEIIEDELKSTDFEYLLSHGYYKSIRNWASKKFNEMTAISEE